MSTPAASLILPRLPGLRDCDYRKIIALPTVVNLPEADFDMWQRAVLDKARLVVLGTTVIETVTMEFLFKIRPRLNEDQLQRERDRLLTTNNIVDWVIRYRQKNNPLARRLTDVVFTSTEELRQLFLAYVGAVMDVRDYDRTRTWLREIFRPYLTHILAVHHQRMDEDMDSMRSSPTLASDSEDEQ